MPLEIKVPATAATTPPAKTQEMAQAQVAQGATTAGSLPSAIYRPSSAGAVADDTDTGISTGSIFGAQQPTNTFADDAPPLPRRRPTGASSAVEQATIDETSPPPQDDSPPQDLPTNSRATTVDAEEDLRLNPRAERTGAIESATRDAETDPFAPTGIRVGSFTLRPSVEQGITATSNADSSNNGNPATLSETTLRLNAISDWSTNSASVDGYVLLRKTLSGDEVEDARGRLDATFNADLNNDWSAVAKLGYEAVPESASSPVVIVGTLRSRCVKPSTPASASKRRPGKRGLD